MRNMLKGVALAAALALWVGPAAAATNLIPGKIAIIKVGKLAKIVAKPVSTFPLPTGAVTTATVDFFDTVTVGNADSYAASAGTWSGLGNPAGSKGWKYKGTKAAGDPCVVVLLKEKVIKAVCKGADVTVDGPFGGEIGVVITTNADTYCASLGGTTVKNQAGLVKRKTASAPGSCPVPASPSTTSTTSTSTTSTTATTIAACCGAERITLASGPGTLQVSVLPPFAFPANVLTIMDVSASTGGLPECKHNVVVPVGGYYVPKFDIPLLNYCSQITPTGCESGNGEGKGHLWDAGASSSSGLAVTGIRKDADTSDGVCDATYNGGGTCTLSGGVCTGDQDCPLNTCVSGFCTVTANACVTNAQCSNTCVAGFCTLSLNACISTNPDCLNTCTGNCDTAGVGSNTLGQIQTTRSLSPGGGVRTVIDVPVHSFTWSEGPTGCHPQTTPGCCTTAIYNPADGDAPVTEFDFILSPTTGSATGAFTDLNGDGCKRAGSGFETVADGPRTLTGTPAPGPCCTVGQATTVVAVGIGLSGAGPLYDLGFKSSVPNTVASCGSFVPGGDCTITTDPCFGSPGGAFID